jgi:hypothetical protein
MSRPSFDALRERLLRAGIAPRHVRRYLAELSNHLDDLVSEEQAKGRSLGDAEAVARARLGTDEALAEALLARPGLRSASARAPWLVFGFGPIVMLLAVLIGSGFLEMGLLNVHFALTGVGDLREGVGAHLPEWLKSFVWVWNQVIMYAAPLAIAALMFFVGMKQRIADVWIALGVLLAAVAGGFHVIEAGWSDEPGRSYLMLGFGLVPPFPQDKIITGALRAGLNLALVGVAYWFWLRRGSFTDMDPRPE